MLPDNISNTCRAFQLYSVIDISFHQLLVFRRLDEYIIFVKPSLYPCCYPITHISCARFLIMCVSSAVSLYRSMTFGLTAVTPLCPFSIHVHLFLWQSLTGRDASVTIHLINITLRSTSLCTHSLFKQFCNRKVAVKNDTNQIVSLHLLLFMYDS